MTPLYTSLGVLMLGWILLITKHSLLFTNQGYSINYYKSEYISSESQMVDKHILKILESNNTNLGIGNDVCFNVKYKIENFNNALSFDDSGIAALAGTEYIVDSKTNSNHPDLINSCVLTNGEHRILIKTSSLYPNVYLLNSCVLKNQILCDFEINDYSF